MLFLKGSKGATRSCICSHVTRVHKRRHTHSHTHIHTHFTCYMTTQAQTHTFTHTHTHSFTCYTSTQAQTHTCTHAHTHTHKRTHTHRDEGLHIIGLQHAWRHLLGGPAARQLQAGMCSARCLRNGLGPLQGGGGGGAREVNKYYSRLECGP